MIAEETLERVAAANPEPRCPFLIVADNSRSMMIDDRIGALNRALPILKSELMDDPLAAKRAEIGIMTISPVAMVSDFSCPADFSLPTLALGDLTPTGAAMLEGLRRIRQRVALYRQEGIRVYRPWIILITDGEPTDDISQAAAELSSADRNQEVNVFVIGVAGANLAKVAPFTHTNSPAPLDGLKFAEFFKWVTVNVKNVTRSATHSGGKPTERVPFTPVKGWIGG